MKIIQRFWHWLTDRWMEHQAFKGHVPPSQAQQQSTLPIVGIAEDAYLRQLIGSHAANNHHNRA